MWEKNSNIHESDGGVTTPMTFSFAPLAYASVYGHSPAAVIFFFSSRRRHTRCSRDWSSDVCSSDLNKCVAVYDDSAHLLSLYPLDSGLAAALHTRATPIPITEMLAGQALLEREIKDRKSVV